MLIALVIIAVTPVATGQELTVYNSYPLYFWFLIIGSFSCGISILIHQAFTKKISKWWLVGLCIVLFANSIILGMPFFRDYGFFPKHDAMSHIGAMKDIIQTGSFGEENIYPGVHLLGAILLVITELTIQAATNLLFISWSLIYLLGTYLLATAITSRRGQALFITAFASPLLFSAYHTTLHPSYLSLFMTPLLLYFIHQRGSLQKRKTANTLVIILLAFAMVITHPMTTLFVICILLTFNITKLLYQHIVRKKKLTGRYINIPGDYNTLIMICAFYALWFFVANDFSAVTWSVDMVYDILFYGKGETLFEEQSNLLSESTISMSKTIISFINRYGVIFIYFLISLVSIAITARRTINGKFQVAPLHFTYAIVFMVALAFSAFSMLALNLEMELARIARFFMMVAPLIIGLVLYEFVFRGNYGIMRFLSVKIKRNIFIGFITILIVVVCVLSTFSVYGSPRTIAWNGQVTRMEINGSTWFLGHRNKGVQIVTDQVEVGRFNDLVFGTSGEPHDSSDWYPPKIHSHFGNDTISSITDTLRYNTYWEIAGPTAYLVTSEFGRMEILYHDPSIRYSHPQYNQNDYKKLKENPAIAQIYSNDEFEVWYCKLESTDD